VNLLKTELCRHPIAKGFTGFIQCEKGTALLEFALSIGVLLLIFFGEVEMSRYVLIYQKVQNVVSAETDNITSINPGTIPLPISPTEMNNILKAADIMMEPYTLTASNSQLMLTDIYFKPGDKPRVTWRYCNVSSLGQTSKFGVVGGAANLSSLPALPTKPNKFTMNSGDEIVVAEIFYNFSPIIVNNVTKSFLSTQIIYNFALSAPRYSLLNNLIINSNCN